MLGETNIDIGIARFVYNNPGNLSKLKKEVTQHLKFHRKDCDYTYIMGHIHYIEENYEAAEKCFKKCAEIDETNNKCQFALAFVYRHLGLYDKCDDILFNKNSINT